METWGTDIFENDIASDWTYELEESSGLRLIEDTIGEALEEGGDYLDADLGARALAAAETVARLLGRGGERSPDTRTVDKWVDRNEGLEISEDLLDECLETIDLVLDEESELRQLWTDADGFDDWEAKVEDLKSRLSA